jgi:heme exporter protein B
VKAAGQVLAIVRKDLLIEWRTRDLLSTMVVLGLTSLVLFEFAVDFSQVPFRLVGPPALWMTFVFTAVLGLARSFALERENRCLEGLLLSPIDRSVLYLGKLLGNFLVLTALQLLLTGAALVLLNRGPGAVSLGIERLAALAGAVALNALGFAAVGTLFALMAQRTRRGDLLLPVLQAVLGLPVLIAAVIATRRLLDPELSLAAAAAPLRLSAAYDVVFVALALLLFESVVED